MRTPPDKRHLELPVGTRPLGLDFSRDMLRVAQRSAPRAALHIWDAGFQQIAWQEHRADEQLVAAVPQAARYLGRPLLLLVRAVRAV